MLQKSDVGVSAAYQNAGHENNGLLYIQFVLYYKIATNKANLLPGTQSESSYWMMEWYQNWEYHIHIGMTLEFSHVMPAMPMVRMRW